MEKTVTFDQWMQQVDRKLARRFLGITSDDLPDWTWQDSYTDGATPAQAIAEFLEEYGEELGAE
jgi:hypothetical protein